VTVQVWGERIREGTPEAHTEWGETVLDRVESFRAWAVANGYSLRPFVDERERGGRTDVLLPTIALAEYAAADLQFVSPCTNAEVGYTVFDRIEALEADVEATETAQRGYDRTPVTND
jgi:hypothetical protein